MIGWMSNMLYVPDLTSNLFSVRAPATKLWKCCVIWPQVLDQKQQKMTCYSTGSPCSRKAIQAKLQYHEVTESRLAHTNSGQLHQLVTNAEGIDIPLKVNSSFCEACIQGKMHHFPHLPLKEIRQTEKLQL